MGVGDLDAVEVFNETSHQKAQAVKAIMGGLTEPQTRVFDAAKQARIRLLSAHSSDRPNGAHVPEDYDYHSFFEGQNSVGLFLTRHLETRATVETMNDDAKSKFHMNEELVRNGLKDIGLDIDIPADVDLFYHVLGRSWELMSEKERIDMRSYS
jgi:hypothetical protein